MLAEPNITTENFSGEIGYFIDEWLHPGEEEANAQKPEHSNDI